MGSPPPTYLQAQMSKMKTKPEEKWNRGGHKMYMCNNCGKQFQRPKPKAPKAKNSTTSSSSAIIFWEMQI